MLNDRRRAILSAVIEDFIYTAEPVGSQRLVDKYGWSVSSATVRNELSSLEELGYLSHPHTSAGRVPTDKGYRFYVDMLSEDGTGQVAELSGFSVGLTMEIGDLMRETSHFLARLTRTMAVVYAPDIKRERVKHIDLIGLGSAKVMIVVILSNGSISKQLFDSVRDAPAETLLTLEKRLNEAFVGELVDDLTGVDVPNDGLSATEAALLLRLCSTVAGSLSMDVSERVYHDGAAQLLDYPELGSLEEMRQALTLIEHNYRVFEWLREAAEAGEMIVRIGAENELELVGYTVIASGYEVRGEAAGALGIIGPRRMDYRRAITAVCQIADKLGNALGELES